MRSVLFSFTCCCFIIYGFLFFCLNAFIDGYICLARRLSKGVKIPKHCSCDCKTLFSNHISHIMQTIKQSPQQKIFPFSRNWFSFEAIWTILHIFFLCETFREDCKNMCIVEIRFDIMIMVTWIENAVRFWIIWWSDSNLRSQCKSLTCVNWMSLSGYVSIWLNRCSSIH